MESPKANSGQKAYEIWKEATAVLKFKKIMIRMKFPNLRKARR